MNYKSSGINFLLFHPNKIIFVNNKPVAVLSDINDFDFRIEDSFEFDSYVSYAIID